MKCFRCLVAFQNNDQPVVLNAEFVYQGQSLCRGHINQLRGHEWHFHQYPVHDVSEEEIPYGTTR